MSSEFAAIKTFASGHSYAKCLDSGKLFVPGAPQFNSIEPDCPHFAAKALFALSVGRAAYAKQTLHTQDNLAQALLEAGADAQALAALPAPPHGFYLLSPDGKISAMFAADIAENPDSFQSGENASAMEAFARNALACGLADKDTYLARAAFDPQTFLERENTFADALENDFGPECLRKYGVRCDSRPLKVAEYTPGYPIAWTCENHNALASYSVTSSFDLLVRFKDLAGLPFINHAKGSVENPRDFTPVNNTEPSCGDNQLDCRQAIVTDMMKAWIERSLMETGLLDEELGLDAEYLDPADKELDRRRLVQSRFSDVGNQKKLGNRPNKTAIRSRGGLVQFVSKDMALGDGQHSSRNYALIAEALARPLDGPARPVYWHGEADKTTDDPLQTGTPVLNCSHGEFSRWMKQTLEEMAPRYGIPAGGLPAALGKDEKECYAEFVRFALDAKTKVTNMPVTTKLHAQQMVDHANYSRALPKSSLAESRYRWTFETLAEAYNEECQARGKPGRLLLVKSAHTDAMIGTTAMHNRSVSDIFPSLVAVCSGRKNTKNDLPDLASAHSADGKNAALIRMAAEASSKLQNLPPNSNARKALTADLAKLYYMIDFAKQRDFMMSNKSAEELSKSVAAIASEERANGGKITEFSKISLAYAASRELGLHICDVPGRINTKRLLEGRHIDMRKQLYSVVAAAVRLQDELDAQWLRIKSDSAGGAVKKFFHSKATFENWMLLGLSVTASEFSSQEALDAIGRSADKLFERASRSDLPENHNKLREKLKNAKDDHEKQRAADSNPLLAIGPESLAVLLDVFPSPQKNVWDPKPERARPGAKI